LGIGVWNCPAVGPGGPNHLGIEMSISRNMEIPIYRNIKGLWLYVTISCLYIDM